MCTAGFIPHCSRFADAAKANHNTPGFLVRSDLCFLLCLANSQFVHLLTRRLTAWLSHAAQLELPDKISQNCTTRTNVGHVSVQATVIADVWRRKGAVLPRRKMLTDISVVRSSLFSGHVIATCVNGRTIGSFETLRPQSALWQRGAPQAVSDMHAQTRTLSLTHRHTH